ncbi:hypothetical protein LTR84_011592 [Exophiala bonariae]|uniref:Amidohydrolase-related domain-containing protein n=1 Tax=Exophiala bonariae TaxID=1690606 RepID=A0AAV9NGF1_9EURO|nr:hypothetical protein LTR84_011592 [Exophiala bonariae]
MFLQILLVALITSVGRACVPQHLDVRQVDQNIQRRSLHTPSSSKIGIANVNLFTGTRFRRGALAIVGGRITFDLKDVDQWINGNSGYLIPGLIDSHCHPGSIGDLKILSSYGVTSAMGMNCANYALCASMKDQPGLTSFFTAGHGIAAPGSAHALIFQTPPELLINSTAEASMFVDYTFGNKSDWLKITAENRGPSQETQNRLVSLTHAAGKQAMTHAAGVDYYLQAIASGTDGIQHTPGDRLLTADAINGIKAHNKWVTATMVLVKAFIASPQALAVSSYTNESWPTVVQNVQKMYKANVTLLVGTDAIPASTSSSLGGIQNPLGKTVHDELDVFVNQVGFTPAEALRAATVLPAKMHRLSDRGVIEAGKRADLVLLRSNPLKNISATRDIVRVWNGGIEFNATAAL